MNKISPKSLIDKNPIFESLFAPLYFKAKESHHIKPIIKDIKSLEILDLFDYDFSYFEKNTSGQFLISVRTEILDEQVNKFVSETENTIIINLGAGLDTRYSRIKSPNITCWYDIDLQEVIDFREHFYGNTRSHKSIGKSVLDYSWIEDIKKDPSYTYLFIVEGLLMYFSKSEIKELFGNINSNFPDSVMLCEVFHSKLVNYNVKNKDKNKDISFKWGITDTKELESMCPGITVENEWKMFEYHKDRQKIFVRILGKISPKFKNLVRIVKLNFGGLPIKKI